MLRDEALARATQAMVLRFLDATAGGAPDGTRLRAGV